MKKKSWSYDHINNETHPVLFWALGLGFIFSAAIAVSGFSQQPPASNLTPVSVFTPATSKEINEEGDRLRTDLVFTLSDNESAFWAAGIPESSLDLLIKHPIVIDGTQHGVFRLYTRSFIERAPTVRATEGFISPEGETN